MNSREYWSKREQEQMRHNITDEKEYDRELRRIYQNMLDACQKEIDSFYGKYAKAEGISLAEAKKRVSKHDVQAFERKAAKYVKDKDFSAKANEELRLYNATMKINRLEMLKANIGLETIAGHDELEKFMAGILKGRTEDELKRQAGILGKTVMNNAAKANAIVNGSFHSGTFSDRIWQYQDLMRQDLGRLLQQGLIQGKGARAIAKDLKKYWYGNDPKTGGGATYCMERLMRTELARVQTEAQKQSFVRNGFDKYIFIINHHASKHGCCEICEEVSKRNTGYSEKGVYLVKDMMPGENAPPMHPHCRCSVAAWEDDEEYEAWLDFLEKGGTTKEWNAMDASVRDQLIAAKKGSIPKYRLKDNEGIFATFDGRFDDKQHDVIKPRHIMNEMKKSEIGTEMLKYLEDNDIAVRIVYGGDIPEGRLGIYEPGEVTVYGENTKTILKTALTVIHEATHAKIDKPNTKNQELECYKNEYRHQNIPLTESVIRDIVAHIDEHYGYLEWE